MAPALAIVRYLHDRFVADHRSGGVSDLLAARIEHRHFTGAEEVLTGEVSPVGVAREVFAPIARAAALYLLERSLLYCAFLLAGAGAPRPEDGKRPRVCAPLLVFPARLADVEGFPAELPAAVEAMLERLGRGGAAGA